MLPYYYDDIFTQPWAYGVLGVAVTGAILWFTRPVFVSYCHVPETMVVTDEDGNEILNPDGDQSGAPTVELKNWASPFSDNNDKPGTSSFFSFHFWAVFVGAFVFACTMFLKNAIDTKLVG